MRWHVVDWMADHPEGVTAHELAAKFSIHHQTAQRWLRELRSDKQVAMVVSGRYSRYCVPSAVAGIRATMAADEARRRRQRNSRRYRASRQGPPRGPEWVVVHRVVPALGLPPPHTTGVASVFDLARQ